ncbi:AMP-binding protein [Candidatus Poribacteria bacterium]|nr:AMP-binding protein [Candidatus Poribacteria bacterium]
MATHGISSAAGLRARAAQDTEWFWNAALEDMGLQWFQPYTQLKDESGGFPWTKWFLGGRINIAQQCLDRHIAARHGDDAALIYEPDSDSDAERRIVSYAELGSLVNQVVNGLKALGVERGDCVGLYAPMRVETVAVFFAALKMGARIVPVFCGYGEDALAERLAASQCKVLFAARTLHRRGKAVDVTAPAMGAQHLAPSVRHLVWMDGTDWRDFLNLGGNHAECVHTEAEEPCLIIYTSGTTGRPKGTVHTHAGCLAQMGKELRYGFDVRPWDVFWWFTDIGWMMGPWELIGVLMYRGTVVLFDGAPDWPDPSRCWRIIERHNVRTFGISPTAIRMLMRADEKFIAPHPMPSLEILGSTGEPWDRESYMWYFDRVGGGRCPVINISGGTEIVGCMLHPLPVEPLKPCTLGGPGLGMDCDILDEEGHSVPTGGIGHLVCRKPSPSMTKGFLGEPGRYLETYFGKFPGVWYHGDWAHRDEDGMWYLHGRSDDTIKVAGKRVGPSEIEGALISHAAVSEAATIGVPDDIKGQALVCFVVLKPGEHVHATAEELIRHVALHMGKPLAPKAVHAVAHLPKTRSGKILRGSIRRAYLGEDPGDLSSVQNPESFDEIRAIGAAKPP